MLFGGDIYVIVTLIVVWHGKSERTELGIENKIYSGFNCLFGSHDSTTLTRVITVTVLPRIKVTVFKIDIAEGIKSVSIYNYILVRPTCTYAPPIES